MEPSCYTNFGGAFPSVAYKIMPLQTYAEVLMVFGSGVFCQFGSGVFCLCLTVCCHLSYGLSPERQKLVEWKTRAVGEGGSVHGSVCLSVCLRATSADITAASFN